jgi:hypothetical protein
MTLDIDEVDELMYCPVCDREADVHVSGYEAAVWHNSNNVVVHESPRFDVYLHFDGGE